MNGGRWAVDGECGYGGGGWWVVDKVVSCRMSRTALETGHPKQGRKASPPTSFFFQLFSFLIFFFVRICKWKCFERVAGGFASLPFHKSTPFHQRGVTAKKKKTFHGHLLMRLLACLQAILVINAEIK